MERPNKRAKKEAWIAYAEHLLQASGNAPIEGAVEAVPDGPSLDELRKEIELEKERGRQLLRQIHDLKSRRS